MPNGQLFLPFHKLEQLWYISKYNLPTAPQLLNCQMQSHFSWLVVSPFGAKKSLVRQFGARENFHPFRQPLRSQNNFVAFKTTEVWLFTSIMCVPSKTYRVFQLHPGKTRESIKPGTKRNGTGSNCCTIRTWCWTHGQKFALIRTVHVCVRTLISCSVTATKTGQAPTESYVKRIKLLR